MNKSRMLKKIKEINEMKENGIIDDMEFEDLKNSILTKKSNAFFKIPLFFFSAIILLTSLLIFIILLYANTDTGKKTYVEQKSSATAVNLIQSSNIIPTSSVIIVSSAIPKTISKSNAEKITAIQNEDSRHQTALSDIDTKYNSQISTLETNIQKYLDGGAKDTTNEISSATDLYNQAKRNYISTVTTGATGAAQGYKKQMDDLSIYISQLELKRSNYLKMVDDNNKLTQLKSDKTSSINQENQVHSNNLQQISITYS